MKKLLALLKAAIVSGTLLFGSPIAAQDTIRLPIASDALHTREIGVYLGALPAVILGSNMGIQPNGVLFRKAFRKGALRLGAQVWFPQTSNSPVSMMPSLAGDSLVVQRRRDDRVSQVRAFVGWEWSGRLTPWARWIMVVDAQFRYGNTNTYLVESTFKLLPNASPSIIDDPPMRFIKAQALATQNIIEIGGGLSLGGGIRVPMGSRFTLHTLTRANVWVQQMKKNETGGTGILAANSFESSAFYFDLLMPMAELGIAYRF